MAQPTVPKHRKKPVCCRDQGFFGVLTPGPLHHVTMNNLKATASAVKTVGVGRAWLLPLSRSGDVRFVVITVMKRRYRRRRLRKTWWWWWRRWWLQIVMLALRVRQPGHRSIWLHGSAFDLMFRVLLLDVFWFSCGAPCASCCTLLNSVAVWK